ncbi:ATP-binding protein [Kordiimonas aestuarii]|uniref:ATP-binding protein n=1 Tax=Kordiimonas aestuarii TaxID=1005925 RepID=UPI0021D08441|nr:ATP-binding protein [Kordiimonas aestuarii]
MTEEGNGWTKVGTVVGNAGTSEFTFILKQFQARVGDIVAMRMEVPADRETSPDRVYVWARVTDIHRFNPFFPYEAAQEIAGEGISLEDTVLSGTRDQLEAVCLILGTTPENNFSRLSPLTYPVKPASSVWHPPAEIVRQLLVGGRDGERNVHIGSLIARSDVAVTLSAPRLVARHLAILAMTGGGKTVAARRIIRALIAHHYPLLILDPHGDYIGLVKCRELLRQEAPGCEIKLFFPELLVQRDGEDLITKLVSQMTSGFTEAQMSYVSALYDRQAADEAEPAFKYIERLLDQIGRDITGTSAPAGTGTGNWKGTVGAARRSFRIVLDKLKRMQLTSEQLRKSSKLKDFPFEPLPSPFSQPEGIIRPGQVSILYLGGYDHVTQCSIAAITMETLFEFRSNLTGRIAPFMTVVEEAHTFIPSVREGTQDAPSLPVIRRIITEGRKFGTGLMLISQRPSRLDETIVSQCNSYLILRLVNPRDQAFVKTIMENLTDADAKMVPGFGPGQGIVSGQVVRFPLPVRVDMDVDLLASEIGDEDFFEQAEAWTPDTKAPARLETALAMATVNQNRRKSKGAEPENSTVGKRKRGRPPKSGR